MKKKVRPDVVAGGSAIDLGNNFYLMKGRTHKQGGIDIGKNPRTGIEVENNEVVQVTPNNVRVFSAQPILNGISPAEALLNGGNPRHIFNAQETWKQVNRVTDDGRKFGPGGYTPSKEIIDYIKKTEAFRDKWYKDGNGIDTIGYGFTGSQVKKLFPNGITREQADKYFADSIAKRAVILARDTPNWDSLTQNQRDALLSYHYNIGEGSYRNKHKNLQKALTEKDWETAIANIDAGYNDKKNPGLRKRRDYERALFRSGSTSSLTGDEEKQFRDWYDRYSRSHDLNPNPDVKEHYYDYRGYWKNRTPEQANIEWQLDSHLPDTYKLPGHPTFSTQSRYSTKKTPGGIWKKVGLGPIYDEQFVDSKYTRRLKTFKNASYAMGGEYTVKKGDTLMGIAKANNIPYETLRRYNPQIANPNVIRIGESINLSEKDTYTPQRRNLREYYAEEEKLNASNISAIQGAKHKQNYAIIDKNGKTIKVYNSNNELLYESNGINLGKSNEDYNTVTYKHKNTKKLLYGEGNNSTPAGITMISSKANYHGNPSFQRARVDGNGNMILTKEGQPDNIASSIHWEKGIAGPNASNGCVRADSKTLQELNKYLDVGSMVYTLPQQYGSRFELRDGKLNFVDIRNQNQRNEDDIYRKGFKSLSDGRVVPLKYHRDLNTVYNGTYMPVEIVDTKKYQDTNPNKLKAALENIIYNTSANPQQPNYVDRFQETKTRNRNEYAQSLSANKQAIMKAIPGLSNKEYNQLLTMALGLPERETHYGTDVKQLATDLLTDKQLSLVRKLKGDKDTVRSIGLGKVKAKADNDELKGIYNTLGLDYNSKLLNNEDSAKMVMSKLAYTYLNEIKGRNFIDADGKPLTTQEALYYAYTGNKKKKISNNTYQYEKGYVKEHFNDVMNYGKEFDIYSQFKYGGIYIKPSKRGTFTSAARRHHMGVQEFARKVLNNRAQFSAAMIKKANFARNASKWHKKEFGGDMTKQFYITPNNIYKLGGDVRPKAFLGTQNDKLERFYDNGTIYYRVGDKTYTKEEFANVFNVNIDDVDTKFNFQDISYIPKYPRNANVPTKIITENPIRSYTDDTWKKYFPNPNFSLGVTDKANPKLSELPGGTKSSVGTAPSNPYYSKGNIALHRIGSFVNNNPDLLGLGINWAGNAAASLINRSAIKGMKYVDAPIPLRAEKLPTEVNIRPQVSELKENMAGQERLIADNTADSRVALARRQRVRNTGSRQFQSLMGEKSNTESQLLIADKLNRQGVDNQNIASFNNWRGGLYEFNNKKREMLAENAVAGINNAAEAFAGPEGYLARKEGRNKDILNMGVIAATSPNAQKVIGSKEFEEFLRKLGYKGTFSLLDKRFNG